MADTNALLAALLQGGNRFGGNTFGGQRHGGNTFGGAQFGASAPQTASVPATMPHMPAFQQPGQMMNSFAPMPNPAALMAQYQAGQRAQTPPVQPPVTPPQAAPPVAAPMSPQMPAADPNAPVTVPPMPPSVAISAAPGMQEPSVLETIWNQLKQQRGGQPVPSWAQNFGGAADQATG